MAVGKESNKVKRSRVKDTFGELKKVAWPSFGKVLKGTGTVVAVVVFFTAILFAIDFGLSELWQLLTTVKR